MVELLQLDEERVAETAVSLIDAAEEEALTQLGVNYGTQ